MRVRTTACGLLLLCRVGPISMISRLALGGSGAQHDTGPLLLGNDCGRCRCSGGLSAVVCGVWLWQFGYVTLFAAAFPLGALFALISNLLQARHWPGTGTGPASGCALKRNIKCTEGQWSTRARPPAGRTRAVVL